MNAYAPLIAALIALLAGLTIGKAWERYKLKDGKWIDRRGPRAALLVGPMLILLGTAGLWSARYAGYFVAGLLIGAGFCIEVGNRIADARAVGRSEPLGPPARATVNPCDLDIRKAGERPHMLGRHVSGADECDFQR